ncbi:MAG: molybdopterin-dependent oxidoreductase [Actinomycetota bacterium]|jgi:4-hydroxybenzoyl-CoA reductase alpha subunit|nr:molybdopterin-dependent oxidoreductase [Actinomycetota bacterium]
MTAVDTPVVPWTGVVGRPLPRVEAAAKVTGAIAYADDLQLPGMLFCKLLRSPHPHARVVSVDTTAARAMRGVVAVLTGHDLPTKYGIMPTCEDEQALEHEKVRFVGDPVAAVAAVDEETALAACRAIQVEYQPLAAVESIEDALAPPDGEPLHDYAGPGNVHRLAALEFGDVEAGFARADHVREDVFFFEGNTHLPMEQHSATAQASDGQVTLWSSTQNPHYVHRALAKVLGLPMGSVRVVAAPLGGGFGGKCDPFSHEIAVCKLALVTGRPVKCTLTREEVFYTHRGRHPTLMWVRTGVDREGHILAMHFRSVLDGGAYGSYGPASMLYTGALQPTTYRIPAYRFEGARVFTSKAPCGPKRGHGTPQPRFALEVHLDKIAEELGIDPVTLRRRNYVEPFTRTVNWLRVTSCGLQQITDRVLDASGYARRRRRLGHGMGFAVSSYMCGAGLSIYWNTLPHSQCVVTAGRGGVTVFCGATDIGQGSDSMLATVAAEELGLQPGAIRLVTGDTGLTPVDLGSYSSRVTFMAGNAAREAAAKLRQLLVEAVAEAEGRSPEQVQVRDARIGSLGFEEAVALAEERFGTLATHGSYTPPAGIGGRYKGAGVGPSPAYSYSAAVVELDADPVTGEIDVHKVWLAHDIGRAINELAVRGQVEGGVCMGLGEALMEAQAYRHGLVKQPSMLDYKSLTFLEMPDVETILVETVDPEGPYGAKEVGQGPLLPVIPAVVSAVHDALGVWVDEVPVTPDKVLRALEARARGRDARYGPKSFPVVPYPPLVKVAPPDAAAPTL